MMTITQQCAYKDCSFTATNENGLFDHWRSVHIPRKSHNPRAVFQCEYPGCPHAVSGKKFKKRDNYTSHLPAHFPKLVAYTCATCSRTFGRGSDGRKHAKTHKGRSSNPIARQETIKTESARKFNLRSHSNSQKQDTFRRSGRPRGSISAKPLRTGNRVSSRIIDRVAYSRQSKKTVKDSRESSPYTPFTVPPPLPPPPSPKIQTQNKVYDFNFPEPTSYYQDIPFDLSDFSYGLLAQQLVALDYTVPEYPTPMQAHEQPYAYENYQVAAQGKEYIGEMDPFDQDAEYEIEDDYTAEYYFYPTYNGHNEMDMAVYSGQVAEEYVIDPALMGL